MGLRPLFIAKECQNLIGQNTIFALQPRYTSLEIFRRTE